jgi:hypothetical protein
MNALARVEHWCASVVERFFARAFPGALEPMQIARRLIATLEHDPPPSNGERPSRYTACVSPADFARLADEREYLERQWSRMAVALCSRARIRAAPQVALAVDPSLVGGTVRIDVEHDSDAGGAPASPLALRVKRGVAAGASYALPRPASSDAALVLGRDAGCTVVVSDPRVSRRHVRVAAGDRAVTFEDLGSSNGTFLNGVRRASGRLRRGDELEIGDTAFTVDASQRGSRP